MKVLQVLYSGLGGHGSVVTSLIDADRNHEWEHSLLFYGVEELLPAYASFCRERAIPYTLVRKKKGLRSLELLAVYRALEKHKPEVILLHSTMLCFPVWLYCLSSRARFIAVEHTANQFKSRVEWVSSFLVLRLASGVVYLTQRYREEMKARFGKLPEFDRTVVIQNGVDTEKFGPRPSDHASARIRFGMVGRFAAPKNQLLLVKVFASLLKNRRIPQSASLHFAGAGEGWQRVKDEVEAGGLAEQVILHGVLDERQLVGFFHGLDVYLHASAAETMCTAIMQAMSCRLPVLASNIDGIRELLVAGEEGLLFENDDPASLENLLVLLASQEALRNRIGLAARRRAEQNFSSMRMFAGYQEAIAAAGGSTTRRKTSA